MPHRRDDGSDGHRHRHEPCRRELLVRAKRRRRNGERHVRPAVLSSERERRFAWAVLRSVTLRVSWGAGRRYSWLIASSALLLPCFQHAAHAQAPSDVNGSGDEVVLRREPPFNRWCVAPVCSGPSTQSRHSRSRPSSILYPGRGCSNPACAARWTILSTGRRAQRSAQLTTRPSRNCRGNSRRRGGGPRQARARRRIGCCGRACRAHVPAGHCRPRGCPVPGATKARRDGRGTRHQRRSGAPELPPETPQGAACV